jgi:hypothetical protein
MFFAGVLLLAGSAGAADVASNIPANEEMTEETGAPYGQPYVDLTSCAVNAKAVTTAMLQIPDEDRGYQIEAATGCMVKADNAAPSQVDDRYRR